MENSIPNTLVYVNQEILLAKNDDICNNLYMAKELFSQRLRVAREAKGLSQQQLAEKVGAYQTKYQNWEKGRNEPEIEMIKTLAKTLDVSVEWLIEGTAMYQVKEASPTYMPTRAVPLISWIRAGRMHYPIDNLQPGESEGPPVPSTCKDRDCFALRVQGDSMMPEFQEGEIIVVSPNTEAHSGDYVVAKYDSEVTFKKLKIYPDAVILRPLNEKFEEIIIKGKMLKNFKIVGKVVEKIKRY